MAIWTTESLIQALDSSRLLGGESIGKLSDRYLKAAARADTPPPEQILGPLIEQGELTRWQAEQLLAGGTSFFVGKYKLLEMLGRGGMGVVFKACHVVMQRTVAVKVIRRSVLQGADATRRFEREVRAAAALDHPHIVRAHDADAAAGMHILAMEYVPGIDMERWMREHGPLSLEWSAELCRQAATGLQHAFEMGLVHRDIKPANFLVTRRSKADPPVLKILDFGLARFSRAADGGTTITQSGDVMGTPDYMSPEQAQESKTADIRSDLFSLGCCLFYFLTGRSAFPGKSIAQKLAAKVLNAAPTLAEAGVEAPPRFEEVLGRLLAKEPRDRYATPEEAARALEPWAALVARKTLQAPFPVTESDEPSLVDRLEAAPELDEVVRWLDLQVTAKPEDSGIATRAEAPAAATAPEPRVASAARKSSGDAEQALPARSRHRTQPVRWLVGIVSLATLVVVIGAAWRHHSRPDASSAETVRANAITERASTPTLRATVRRGGESLFLEDALPLRTGDGVWFEGRTAADRQAALFWLDGEGALHDLELVRQGRDSQDTRQGDASLRFTSPMSGKDFPLEDPVGTEVVFIVEDSDELPTREQLLKLFGDASPWPPLPKGSMLHFDNAGSRLDSTRGPGASRIWDATRARSEELRLALLGRYDAVRGLAFPHE